MYIIGRHHLQYRPALPEETLKKIHLLPTAPSQIFTYPPNPDANQFVKYRVQRLIDPSVDPLMTADEQAILDELKSRGITGAAALATILRPEVNADVSINDGLQRWYSHHFALSGGDELTFDQTKIYGTPVQYRTWFQVAVHEIG